MYIMTNFLFGNRGLGPAPEREGRKGRATVAPLLEMNCLRDNFMTREIKIIKSFNYLTLPSFPYLEAFANMEATLWDFFLRMKTI
jgi:hypothetical protein